ncbi:MAG: hypothetical protein ACE5KM_22350, partial [Planctomycetaceae bacterium]
MKSLSAFLLCVCAIGLTGCVDAYSGSDGSVSNASESAKTNDTAKAGDNRRQSPQEIFKRRILPIMNSPQASSCTECHLSGVALQAYIHSDQATTFAALRKDGLIDVKDPEKSKILTFIARKPKKPNPITDKVRKQEFAAFKAWLMAAAKDPALLKASADEVTLGTKLPPQVIRHARKDRVLSSFVDNVWSQVGRCISCHSPNKNARQVKKHGEQMSWIVPNDPAGTLKELVEAGNIDTDDPAESPVLTKPAGLSKHGGGPKFLVGGPAYRGFLRFLTDYAAITNGKYQSTKDIPEPPKELILLGKQHLRIVDMPAAWHKLPMRVDLYHWDKAYRRWSKDRWGTAFGPIQGKRRMWQNLVAVTARR